MAKGHEGDLDIAKWELSFVVYTAKVSSFITNLIIDTKKMCSKVVSSYFRNISGKPHNLRQEGGGILLGRGLKFNPPP